MGSTCINEGLVAYFVSYLWHSIGAGVIGSDVPWLECPGLQCFNMGHNGHRINLYGVSMTLMGN